MFEEAKRSNAFRREESWVFVYYVFDCELLT